VRLQRGSVLAVIVEIEAGRIAEAERSRRAGIGAVLEAPAGISAHGFWFGEDQARYVVTGKNAETVMQRAKAAGVLVRRLGATGGAVLALDGERPLPVAELKKRFEGWLPAYMAGVAWATH